jgi:hypothetical protein
MCFLLTINFTISTTIIVFILFIYLFIHVLFNDAVSSSDYTASNDRMINKLEMIWKEAVMT